MKPSLSIWLALKTQNALTSFFSMFVGGSLAFLLTFYALFLPFWQSLGLGYNTAIGKEVLFVLGGLFLTWLIVYFTFLLIASFITNDLLFLCLDKPKVSRCLLSLSQLFKKKIEHYHPKKLSFLNFLASSGNWSQETREFKHFIFDYIIKHKLYQNTSIEHLFKAHYFKGLWSSELLIWILDTQCEDDEWQNIKKSLLNYDFLSEVIMALSFSPREMFLKPLLIQCVENQYYTLYSSEYQANIELFHLFCGSGIYAHVEKEILERIINIDYELNGLTYFHYLFKQNRFVASFKIQEFNWLLSLVNIHNKAILEKLDSNFNDLVLASARFNHEEKQEIFGLIEQKKIELEQLSLNNLIVLDVNQEKKIIKI